MAQASQDSWSQSGLWTPSMPIIFSKNASTRTIRKDFTWKRGNDIIIGPGGAAHKRTYATKKPAPASSSPQPRPAPAPAPARYQPRIQKKTGTVADPNNLSFLSSPGAPPPKASQPRVQKTTSNVAPPSKLSSLHSTIMKEMALEKEMARESSASVATPSNTPEPPPSPDPVTPTILSEKDTIWLMQDALVASDLAIAEKEAFDVAAKDKDSEVSTLVDDFGYANRLLRESLAATQALNQALGQQKENMRTQYLQERQQREEARAAAQAEQEQKLADLRDKLEQHEIRHRKIPPNFENILEELKATKAANSSLERNQTLLNAYNRSLLTTIETLQRDLDSERDPKRKQLERLTKYQELRLAQENRDRREDEENKRAVQRATYTDFQNFFNTGSRDTRRWLTLQSGEQGKLNKRTANYWQRAVTSLDNFVKEIKSKDDFRHWDARTAAASHNLSTQETTLEIEKLEARLNHRDHFFEALSADLQARSDHSRRSLVDFEDLLWDFENRTWDELKLESHSARHFVRILRYPGGSSPGFLAREYFNNTQSAKITAPMRDLNRYLVREAKDLRRAISRESDHERRTFLRKRKDAVESEMDLIQIALEFAIRHDDLVETDWLKKQPLASSAMVSNISPLLHMHTELRVRIERAPSHFLRFGLSIKHDFLELFRVYQSRKLISELESVAYRNAVLAERHGKSDDKETARLKAFPSRQYQESSSHLKSLWKTFQTRRLHEWSRELIRARHQKRFGIRLDLRSDANELKSRSSPTLVKRVTRPEKEVVGVRRAWPPRATRLKEEVPHESPESAAPEVRNAAKEDAAKENAAKEDAAKENAAKEDAAKEDAAKEDATKADSAKQDATKQDASFESFDSPMDFFESPQKSFSYDVNMTDLTATDEQEVSNTHDADSDVEDLDDASEPLPKVDVAVPKPSYRFGKQPAIESSRNESAYIKPKRGVFPKPDYMGRGRRRLAFKPTRSRRHDIHPQSSDLSERIWLAHEDKSFDGSSFEFPEHTSHPTTAIDSRLSSAVPTRESAGNTSSNTAQCTSKASLTDQDDIHVPLQFQIPPQDLRTALLASTTSGAAFWKHSLYKGPQNEKITIHYCTKFDQAEKQARLFLNESILGFDAEWEPGSKGDVGSIKDNMSLIQIACENRIALFQIASFHGDTAEDLMPPSLKIILESPRIIKAGVNIGGDYTRLRRCFGIQGQGLFELSHLFKIVKFSDTDPAKIDKKPYKMADQVQEVLYLPLAKGAVRTSAWSKRLSPEQIEYAASDAYAGFRLFDALEERRKRMNPIPPRPALYELQKPLMLGNGKAPPRKRKTAENACADKAATVEKQDGDLHSAEELVEHEKTGEGAESEDQFYSCDSDDAELEDSHPADTKETWSPTSDVTAQVLTPLAPPELVKAERWMAEWRASLSTNQKPRATPAYLRAYALWHPQSLEVGEVAALLREPPLALSSVSQYILEAVKHENLQFEPGRLREVFKFVPFSAQLRYSRIVEKLRKMEGS